MNQKKYLLMKILPEMFSIPEKIFKKYDFSIPFFVSLLLFCSLFIDFLLFWTKPLPEAIYQFLLYFIYASLGYYIGKIINNKRRNRFVNPDIQAIILFPILVLVLILGFKLLPFQFKIFVNHSLLLGISTGFFFYWMCLQKDFFHSNNILLPLFIDNKKLVIILSGIMLIILIIINKFFSLKFWVRNLLFLISVIIVGISAIIFSIKFKFKFK